MPSPAPPETAQNFLPDFCNIRMVFAVVILAELCAFLLAFAPLTMTYLQRWQYLGITSLFVQWLALSSCAILCLARRWLTPLGDRPAALVSFGLILLMVGLISEAAFWLFVQPTAPSVQHSHFMLRNLFLGAMIAAPMLRYFYVQHQWRQRVRSESSARLQALQARIRPHFLFNSMNTIASLTRRQPEQAEAAVENLADLFRASMSDRRLQPWSDEYTLCQRYLAIEAMRLGERLQLSWSVSELPDDALLPPLLIQPLLENAIYHGIEPRQEGGAIQIEGQRDGEQLNIRISNPLPQQPAYHTQGNQLAVENIRERLSTLYADKAQLQVSQDAQHYSVELTLPYWSSNEDFDRR